MILLERQEDQTIETKGKLTYGDFSCPTLELPWRGNERKISCIPKGLYKWEKTLPTANIPYLHIEILNVPGRNGICIHAANFAAGKTVQLLGCIAVGSGYADIDGDKIEDIVNSKSTFEKLMNILPDEGEIMIK